MLLIIMRAASWQGLHGGTSELASWVLVTMELRADAARTRVAIVEAAREVFARQSLDASLDDSARRAGTGNATLYRRFPTRGDLIHAALADQDPWGGFASYFTAVGAMQARDRGIADLVIMDVTQAPEIDALRARTFKGLVRPIARAAGVTREDFTTQDVVLLLMATARLVERAHDIAEDASARLVHLLLDGVRAAAAAFPGSTSTWRACH